MEFNLGQILTNPIGTMGNIWNDLTGNTAMKMNEDMFNKQMNWSKEQFAKQIELSNSAHQRETDDLKKAGINPILTATGGQGANSAASASIPAIPDNTAGMKGMQGLFNLVMGIAPQIAQLKNANSAATQAKASETIATAQSAKLFAEAGKIATEKEINQFIKQMKGYEWKHYPDIIEANISKSPLWILKKLEQGFKLGTNSTTAKKFESYGNKIYDAENNIHNILYNDENPKKILSGLITTLLNLYI